MREYLDKQLKLNEEAAKAVDKAAISTGQRNAQDAQDAAAKRQKQLSNSLMYGGSAAALKLSVLGPQLQEEKKQTNLLKEIASNTKDTALSIEKQAAATDVNASIWD